MTKEEIKIISETMVGMSKGAIASSLDFVKRGFEAFKALEIPRVSQDGQYCYGIRFPYKENKALQEIVDFMIVYLDESIKAIDNQMKKEENKQ